MVNFAGEEDAADVRHNTHHTEPDWPFSAKHNAPTRRTFTPSGAPLDLKGSELCFVMPDGSVWHSLGRPRQHSDAETLDLRIILAHLDSAAQSIQAELNRRHTP